MPGAFFFVVGGRGFHAYNENVLALTGTRMSKLPFIACTIASAILCSGAAAQDRPPNFAPDNVTAWVPARSEGDDFIPPDSGPGPVTADKDHPYVPNNPRIQPTYRIADLTNPILKPWAIERMRKSNDEVRAGKIPFTADSTCWPGGVPGFDVYAHVRPIFFLQTKDEVTIIMESDMQVRHVYMNVPHSKEPKPSWYGESVGRYEGDELVIDTIGMNDRTFVDNYRTPHTGALHVVERFKMLEGGKILQVTVDVDDPGAFNTSWSAKQQWRRREGDALIELICAENHTDYFNNFAAPIPQADTADF
jgi:hypothetical protein